MIGLFMTKQKLTADGVELMLILMTVSVNLMAFSLSNNIPLKILRQ